MQRSPHYELKATMARKGLTLRRVAKTSGVEYCRASEILSGARIDPDNLERLKFTINSAAMPEVAA
jgi:transcriptional regulator with XRE-family HTH domain